MVEMVVGQWWSETSQCRLKVAGLLLETRIRYQCREQWLLSGAGSVSALPGRTLLSDLCLSLDLNPIEHLWDIMFHWIHTDAVSRQTVQETRDALILVWEDISQKMPPCHQEHQTRVQHTGVCSSYTPVNHVMSWFNLCSHLLTLM